jgi:hypothetical protein
MISDAAPRRMVRDAGILVASATRSRCDWQMLSYAAKRGGTLPSSRPSLRCETFCDLVGVHACARKVAKADWPGILVLENQKEKEKKITLQCP